MSNHLSTLEGTLITENNVNTTIINHTIEENSSSILNGKIIGKRTSDGGTFAAQFIAVIKRRTGDASSTIVLAPDNLTTPINDGAGMNQTGYVFNLVNDNIQIDVNGNAGEIIHWLAILDFVTIRF